MFARAGLGLAPALVVRRHGWVVRQVAHLSVPHEGILLLVENDLRGLDTARVLGESFRFDCAMVTVLGGTIDVDEDGLLCHADVPVALLRLLLIDKLHNFLLPRQVGIGRASIRRAVWERFLSVIYYFLQNGSVLA